MMRRLALTSLFFATAFVASAHAQNHPVLLPSRDVAIIYRLPGGDMGNGAQKLQAAYADGGQRIRLDFFRYTESKYPFETWIYDGIGNRFTKIYPERREYTVAEAPTESIPGDFINSEMQFTKQGIAAVAKQPCTNWAIKSSDPVANGTLACVTDDGVLLRMAAPDPKTPPVMVAQLVQFGSLASALFAAPPGFMRLHSSD